MQKDFDKWNKEKKHIEKHKKDGLVFHEREIWWCSLGLNIGDEQDGKHEMFERPVLILKKFNNRIAWVLPMTGREKEGVYYHTIYYQGKASSVILSQLRLLSSNRFGRLVRKISSYEFHLIQQKIIGLIKK